MNYGYATKLTESNIIAVKHMYLHDELMEVHAIMKGGVSQSRWYKVPYEKVPPTIQRFCEKRTKEVFSDEDEYGIKKYIYRR